MSEKNNDPRQLDVWMDGNCELCRASRAWCEARDRNHRIQFIDFRHFSSDELPLKRESHETSMWVRNEHGALLDGFAGWLLIMAEIPGWKLLARLASLPPISLVGPFFYRLIAANRHRLNQR